MFGKIVGKKTESDVKASFSFERNEFDSNWRFKTLGNILVIITKEINQVKFKNTLFSIFQKLENGWFPYRTGFPFFVTNKKIFIFLENEHRKQKFYLNLITPKHFFFKTVPVEEFSELKRNKKKKVFLVVKGIGIVLALKLIEKILFSENKTKILLILKTETFDLIPLFSRIKCLERRSQNFKIFYVFKKLTRVNEKEENELIKKKIQFYVGKPEIGKSIFLIGFKKKRAAMVQFFYDSGFSRTDIKIFQ